MSKAQARLNILVSEDVRRQLQQVADEQGCTITEVIRRSFALYKFAVEQNHKGAELLIKEGGIYHKIVLL